MLILQLSTETATCVRNWVSNHETRFSLTSYFKLIITNLNWLLRMTQTHVLVLKIKDVDFYCDGMNGTHFLGLLKPTVSPSLPRSLQTLFYFPRPSLAFPVRNKLCGGLSTIVWLKFITNRPVRCKNLERPEKKYRLLLTMGCMLISSILKIFV